MPRPSKYDDSLWLSIYEELEKASDGNEGDEIFNKHAEKIGAKFGGIKAGFTRWAGHRRAEGDTKYLKEYARLYPGKVNALEETLTQYNKKQILDWIGDNIDYPIPNMEYTKQSLEGGFNDKYFEGILATIIFKDMDSLDEEWKSHRRLVHAPIRFWTNLQLSGSLIMITGAILNWGSWESYLIILAGILFFGGTIFTNIRTFKKLEEMEADLIIKTEDKVINKYPPELLLLIYKTYEKHIHMRTHDGKDPNYEKYIDDVLDEGIDFSAMGLIDYMLETSNMNDLLFTKLKLLPLPLDRDYWWQLFYKLSGVSLVDVATYEKIKREVKEHF